MPFDVAEALKAGYSQQEIATFLGEQKKFDTQKAFESGYSPDEVISFLNPKEQTTGERLKRAAVKGFEAIPESAAGIGLGVSSALGLESTGRQAEAIRKEAKKEAELPQGITWDELEKTYGTEGAFAALKKFPTYVAEQILQSAPSMAIPLAAGAAGAAVSGPLAPIVGPIAGIGAYGVQQFGQFMRRQAEEGATPETLSPAKAAIGSAVTAPIGYFADRFTLGMSKVPTKVLGEEISKELAKRTSGVAGRAVTGASLGIIAEAPTEVLEQAAERWQAGLDLTGEEAKKEYKEAFFGAAAVGGVGGAAARVLRGAPPEPEVAPPPAIPPSPVAEPSLTGTAPAEMIAALSRPQNADMMAAIRGREEEQAAQAEAQRVEEERAAAETKRLEEEAQRAETARQMSERERVRAMPGFTGADTTNAGILQAQREKEEAEAIALEKGKEIEYRKILGTTFSADPLQNFRQQQAAIDRLDYTTPEMKKQIPAIYDELKALSEEPDTEAPPVTPPVTPITPPVAPVVEPIAPPVAAPIAPPVAPPVVAPVAAPVAAPIAPPVAPPVIEEQQPIKQDKSLASQPTYTESTVLEVPVPELTLSKDVPQFKSDANQNGVVQATKLEGKFDRRLASPVQVWQRNNGQLEVISGRHRLDLAQRSGEKTIPAQIYKESEGFNADMARMLDIELNVKDGRGKVKDYVSFFKEFGLPKEQARAEGLLNTAIGRQAYEIADAGSPSLIAAHFNKDITDDAATAIAINAPRDEALQNLGMQQVRDGKSINHAVNFMRSAMAAGFKGKEGSGDLFGFDDSFAKEAEAVTKEATKQQREARQQLSAIKGAAKSPEKARLGGVDVKNLEQTQAKIAELEKTINELENFHTNPDLYKKLRQAAGLEEGLVAPTPEALKAQEERAKSEEKRIAAEKKAADDKAKADAEVGEYKLAGSDRAADQDSDQGQMFEEKAPPELDTSGLKEVKGRHPQIQAAAKLLQEGKMTREKFEEYVDYYKPIQEIQSEKLLPPTSEQKMNETVNADKRDKINAEVKDGEKVGLRMDLPARERGGSVVSIHEGKAGKQTIGKLKGFRSTGWLKDVTFEVRSQEKGLAVAAGASKAPQQTVEGTWFNLSPEETYAKVKQLMKDPAWSQIGFDPSRHGYFYDRKTRQPVTSASEMYQVGQFLLAKNVKYAPKEQFLYSLEPTSTYSDIAKRNPSFKRRIDKLNRDLDSGKIELGEFANKVQWAADAADRARDSAKPQPRQRGADFIRQRLLEAKRRGELSEEAVDFAEWFIQRNPQLLDDLGISIKKAKEEGISGQYLGLSRIMQLIKESSNDSTIVHEILHHMERMMPLDVQRAIRSAWADAMVKAASKASDKKTKEFFGKLIAGHGAAQTMASPQALKDAVKMIKDGDVGFENYQYVNPSEFWAVNGTEIVQGRFDAVRGGTLQKLKNWLKELGQKIKSLFGLPSNAPIIRAIDSLSKSDGKFVSTEMLTQADEYFSITDKLKESAQKFLQTRQPLDREALSHVQDEDFKDALGTVFNPQRKTVIDKVEGMKDGFWRRVAQGVADQYRTIKDYDPVSYMLARLSKTVDGALEGLMLHGHVFNDGGALNIRQNTKGMLEALKPLGKEVDSYQMWIALNRESKLPPEKRSPNISALVPNKDLLVQGTLNGKPRLEVYQSVQKDMNALNKSVLDVALNAGIINSSAKDIAAIRNRTDLTDQQKQDKIDKIGRPSKEEIAKILARTDLTDEQKQKQIRENKPGAYEIFSNDIFYIPFYKEMEDGDVQSSASAAGLDRQKFSAELKGMTDKPFGDLMENTLRNWSHILSASMKNQAANSTINATMKAGATIPNMKVGLAYRDGVVYSTKNDEVVGDGVLRPEQTSSEGKGMVKIMRDGHPMYFEVLDPMLLESIISIGYMGPKSKFLEVARDFKNVLQFGVTISPTFKVNNLIRDSISAMAVSALKKTPWANVAEGWAASRKNNPAHISALAGGAVFNFGSTYEGDQARLVKQLIKQGVRPDSILDSPEKIKAGMKLLWNKYQEFGNRSEAANRLALYNQLREKGMSHMEASFQARDLLDFSMQGSWQAFRTVTMVVPFLNARVQGLYKLGRDGITPTTRVLYNTITGKEITASDKQKAYAFSVTTSAVALASMALYMAFKDDEDFQKRDEWDRDNFWWIKIPGMEYALRVPKPFEVGAFGTLAERTLEQIVDQGSEGKQFGSSIGRMLFDTFALNPTPQMFKPLIDLYANKDSFTGAPIESAGMERLSKQERATDTTSPIAKLVGGMSSFLGEKGELSPVQVDYAIKSYFGWLGATAATTSMYATMPFREGAYPDTVWMDKASLGLIKTLPSNQSRYTTAFYESNKDISQAFADMRHFAEAGESEKVERILEEKGDKIALAKFYDKTAKSMANIRKQIRMITNDESMSGADKREEIDRMKEIISMLSKQAEDTRKAMK